MKVNWKGLLVAAAAALVLFGCKEEPADIASPPEEPVVEQDLRETDQMEQDFQNAMDRYNDRKVPWGIVKIEELQTALQGDKCRFRANAEDAERMYGKGAAIPSFGKEGDPLCLPDGIPVGNFGESYFSGVVLVMSNMSDQEPYIAVCLNARFEFGERADRLYRTEQEEECRELGGEWKPFEQWNEEER